MFWFLLNGVPDLADGGDLGDFLVSAATEAAAPDADVQAPPTVTDSEVHNLLNEVTRRKKK